MVPGIVLYAPALALSAVTGLHFEGAVIGIGDHMIPVARNNNNNNNNKTTVIGISDFKYDDVNNNSNNPALIARIQCLQKKIE